MFVQSHQGITYRLIPLSPLPNSDFLPAIIPTNWETESVRDVYSLTRCNTTIQTSPRMSEMGIQVDLARQVTQA